MAYSYSAIYDLNVITSPLLVLRAFHLIKGKTTSRHVLVTPKGAPISSPDQRTQGSHGPRTCVQNHFGVCVKNMVDLSLAFHVGCDIFAECYSHSSSKSFGEKNRSRERAVRGDEATTTHTVAALKERGYRSSEPAPTPAKDETRLSLPSPTLGKAATSAKKGQGTRISEARATKGSPHSQR